MHTATKSSPDYDDFDDSDESFCARIVDRELAAIFSSPADRAAHRAAAVEAALVAAALARELNLGIEDAAADSVWRAVPVDTDTLYLRVFKTPAPEDVADAERRAAGNPLFGVFHDDEMVWDETPEAAAAFAARQPMGVVYNEAGLKAREEAAAAREPRRVKPLPNRATPFVWRDPSTIPPRQWLHGKHYVRGYLSATIAPGGYGKSTNAIMDALAMASGWALPLRPTFDCMKRAPLRVWYINGEDPRDEIERRFAAAMLFYGMTPEDVEGRLFIDSGHEKNFVFAREQGREGVVVEKVLVENVVATIRADEIDCSILDPLVSFHKVGESDNTKMQTVVDELAFIANATASAIEVVAHTRKANGEVITADDTRGASAVHDKSRSLRTINRMTPGEGEKAGLPLGDHVNLIRVDSGKANMTRPGGQGSQWRRLVSVDLGNGDEVQACDAWFWPRAEEAEADTNGPVWPTPEQVEAILAKFVSTRISQRASEQSPDWAGYSVLSAMGLNPEDKANKRRAADWLDYMVEHDHLKREEGQKPNRSPCWNITVSEKVAKARLSSD